MDGKQRQSFVEREQEYQFRIASFTDIGGEGRREGVLCLANDDSSIPEETRRKLKVPRVWGWGEKSGLEPAWIYLRHCILACRKGGEEAERSFLDETFLVDRKTTIRDYLQLHPEVLDSSPPPYLESRFNG